MSTTVLSLFGDEIVPEQVNAVGKSRAVKKEEPKEEAKPEPQPEQKPETKPEPKHEIQPEAKAVVKEIPEVPKAAKPAAKKATAAKARPAAKKKVAKKEVKKDEVSTGPILEGWVADKQYYSIGEVAGLFRVATSHIRFWTNEFAMKVRTTRKGDRLYSPDQVNELRVIYHLVKEQGYTISGAKARLKDTKKAPSQGIDLKQSLLQLRNKLVDIKNQL